MRIRSSSSSVFASAAPLAVALLVVLTALVACSSKDNAAPRNGVDDVLKACQIRASWTKANTKTCVDCVAAAPEVACSCPDLKDFGGLCLDQNNARKAEPTCTDAVETCARTCKPTDCTCVENCYATAPNCKVVQAAEDGCVADVCTQYCQ